MTKIQDLIKKEEQRQSSTINLIASENYPSEGVRQALSSSLVGKYAEGRPGARYYAGNLVVDEIEIAVEALVLKVFGLDEADYAVNVQPYSGSIANLASYLGALDIEDSILAMSLTHGGHLTHGHSVSLTGKLFKFSHYGVSPDSYLLDYDAIKGQAVELRPKLIVCGATAYPRAIDFAKFREIADSCGALLMADISHIAGLIAGGAHVSPFPYADIVTSTTHKTLRGPRGAFIITRKGLKKDGKELSELINRAIFPGLQGGPHMHTIASMGVALEEALTPEFRDYAHKVVDNAQIMAEKLDDLGFEVLSGGTDNHLILINVLNRGYSGQEAQEILEKNGIIVNKNSIPFDTQKPNNPSGIRIGVQAETTRGRDSEFFVDIATKISAILPKK